MIIPAQVVIDRARKFVQLRKPELIAENIDPVWPVATVCWKMATRLYARGHSIIEYEYGMHK
jgi:hypothetical protein